ncbi:efflux RND transporter permease subunit, partial [Acinetobacter baumannii]|uniref:efflux RND transporter permease subunit n=1 Tax=Acinetobacter baumannii TaxID=470 RepID=UPI000ABA80B3
SEPIYYLAISTKNGAGSDDSLNSLVKDTIVPELEDISGVEKVSTIGERINKVHIYPNLSALSNYGFSASQFKQLIQANHVG